MWRIIYFIKRKQTSITIHHHGLNSVFAIIRSRTPTLSHWRHIFAQVLPCPLNLGKQLNSKQYLSIAPNIIKLSDLWCQARFEFGMMTEEVELRMDTCPWDMYVFYQFTSQWSLNVHLNRRQPPTHMKDMFSFSLTSGTRGKSTVASRWSPRRYVYF